jgi:hypothetical protein
MKKRMRQPQTPDQQRVLVRLPKIKSLILSNPIPSNLGSHQCPSHITPQRLYEGALQIRELHRSHSASALLYSALLKAGVIQTSRVQLPQLETSTPNEITASRITSSHSSSRPSDGCTEPSTNTGGRMSQVSALLFFLSHTERLQRMVMDGRRQQHAFFQR